MMQPGVDVVAVPRIARAIARHPGFLARVFTAREVRECLRDGVAIDSSVAARRFAARFAAKEATKKAVGERLVAWHEVEVVRGAAGAPRLLVRGDATRAAVSLSHDGDLAVAFVIASDRGDR